LKQKSFEQLFLYLQLRFLFFWRKEIGPKAARKMLVKFTADEAADLLLEIGIIKQKPDIKSLADTRFLQ
jgi:NitT/TauT family transport system substrate-binding protein